MDGRIKERILQGKQKAMIYLDANNSSESSSSDDGKLF